MTGTCLAGYFRQRKRSTPKLFYVKTSEIVVLGALGAAALVLFSKARAAGSLFFLPGRISSITFDNATPVVQLSLIAQNTSSQGLTIESMAGNILTEGDYIIGNFSNFTPIHIAGNAQSAIPVTIRLQLVGLVQDIITSFATGSFSKRLTLRGLVNAGFVRAPIDVTFEVGSGLNKKQ